MYDYFEKRTEEEISMFTDLAIERRRADTDTPGVKYEKRKSYSGGAWETVKITSDEGEKAIGRPRGIYATLNLDRIDDLDDDECENAQDEIARKLCEICDTDRIIPARILVVGLGNRSLTPDSLGPKAAAEVTATMHVLSYDEDTFYDLECSEIAVIAPDVSARSGLDAAVLVSGVCEKIKPDLVIAIDALASRSPERLGRTIQISNTGIFPGSGVGNTRGEISRRELGVAVIAIGVPTVMDSRHFSKSGVITGEPMFVSPREIDGIVRSSAKIIGGAINQAFGI